MTDRDNEEIALGIESASSEPTAFLIAHAVRIGLMEKFHELQAYAKENKLPTQDLGEAVLKILCAELAAMLDWKQDPETVIKMMSVLFDITFRETWRNKLMIELMERKDGRG